MLLLVACAPAPASMPWVHIDRSLPGVVVSHAAAKVWAAQRIRDRATCDKAIDLEKENTHRAEVGKKAAEWWRDFGPPAIAGGTILGIIMGVVLGSQIRLR
jgi:hypothetical protein